MKSIGKIAKRSLLTGVLSAAAKLRLCDDSMDNKKRIGKIAKKSLLTGVLTAAAKLKLRDDSMDNKKRITLRFLAP